MCSAMLFRFLLGGGNGEHVAVASENAIRLGSGPDRIRT